MNQESMLEAFIKGTGHQCLFLPKFHCELNPIKMYWGWCKYRYWEHPKNNFAEAKTRALEVLDACPAEVIRRFIDAYRKGLTGEAAAWAVCKQRSHRGVSESAMKALEARSKQ